MALFVVQQRCFVVDQWKRQAQLFHDKRPLIDWAFRTFSTHNIQGLSGIRCINVDYDQCGMRTRPGGGPVRVPTEEGGLS